MSTVETLLGNPYFVGVLAGIGFMAAVCLFAIALLWVCARDEEHEADEAREARTVVWLDTGESFTAGDLRRQREHARQN